MEVDNQRAPTVYRRLGPEFASGQRRKEIQRFGRLHFGGFSWFSPKYGNHIPKHPTFAESTA